MDCSLCKTRFDVDAKTYKPDLIPDPKANPMWKKGQRTEVKSISVNLCPDCITAIQSVTSACQQEVPGLSGGGPPAEEVEEVGIEEETHEEGVVDFYRTEGIDEEGTDTSEKKEEE